MGNSSNLQDRAKNRSPSSHVASSGAEMSGEKLDDLVLPELLRELFWDCQFDEFRLPRDLTFVLGRVLTSGSWSQIGWLRERVGDDGLRHWICQHEGRTLDLRQLRFWELILDLPAEQVNKWLARRTSSVWDQKNFRKMGHQETDQAESVP